MYGIDAALRVAGDHEAFAELRSRIALNEQADFLAVSVRGVMNIDVVVEVRRRLIDGRL